MLHTKHGGGQQPPTSGPSPRGTSAVQQEEPNAVREATDRLLALPHRVLDARGRGAAGRTSAVSRLGRVHRCEPLDDEQMQGEHPDERPGGRFCNGPLHRQQRRRIHRQLQLGNISRAARVQQESPLATVTDEVLEVLTALHLHEDAPQPPAAEECPAQITSGILVKVLDKVPRGSAAGPSGWTYEHVKAAVKASQEAEIAVLELMFAMVQGKLPHVLALLQSTLLPISKPCGGIQPIAIGEIWYRLAGHYALSTCKDVCQSLAPLQLAVGVPGGAQIVSHTLAAGIAAEPDCIKVQLDLQNAFNTLSRQRMLDFI
jgi:hypothetical protein